MQWRMLLPLLSASAALAADPAAQPGKELFADDFNHGLRQWAFELQPGGAITAGSGQLVIDDANGCTAWFRPRLTAPVVITYEATMSAMNRVSDLGCFWMASEPGQPAAAPYAAGHARDGNFGAYASLNAYYVGYGVNANTSTRFRRYDGHGARPALPEHDRSSPEFRLVRNHVYHIMLIVTADGRVQFVRDGEVVFDFRDPAPLKSGWFGFRTENGRMELSHFRVSRPD